MKEVGISGVNRHPNLMFKYVLRFYFFCHSLKSVNMTSAGVAV